MLGLGWAAPELVAPRGGAGDKRRIPSGTKGTPSFAKGKLRVRCPGSTSLATLSLSRGTTATQLLFRGEAKEWFKLAFQEGADLLVSLAADDDDVVLELRQDRPSAGTAKPRGAYEVIAVRPDWTDNRGLLGYDNPIARDYQVTPFLRLLLRARQEADRAEAERRSARPFFAVLDEMNLARVEHYFSDFLSCLESGEKLHLHDDSDVEQGAAASGEAVPMRLRIPSNLFFTGTINVDETTYMFSPKVLDRAFTLEFNDVDLESFGSEQQEDAADGDQEFVLTKFQGTLELGRPPSMDDWRAMKLLLHGRLCSALVSLNETLQRDHRHFGYRVANEIARFLDLTARQSGAEDDVLWTAFDLAILAKVLPKLNGTQQELEETLRLLFSFAVTLDSNAVPLATDADWVMQAGSLRAKKVELDKAPSNPKLPRTAAKLWRMLRRLREQGFASFVE